MPPVIAAWLFATLAAVPTPDRVRSGVGASLPLLMHGAEGHIGKQTCFACHNQALPMLAVHAVRGRGIVVDDAYLKDQTDFIAAFLRSNKEKFRKGEGTGGQVDTAGYALLTLELGGRRPDDTTAAVVEYLLKRNADRDHWPTVSNRPPSEASSFTPTYLALRGLRVWGPPDRKDAIAKRVEKVRGWVLKTPAKDTEDRVFRLLALKEAAAKSEDRREAADALRKTQRADGSWSQLDGRPGDPYATGSALVALHQDGELKTDDIAYRRGLWFLLATQRADGSWMVKSRSKPFQPYYESGFPHGKDQFISVAASGWATAALALACEPRAAWRSDNAMSNPTTRFSDRVADYVATRPGYPAGVLDVLRAETGFTANAIVADIGSGTGLSAEPFLRNGNIDYGVEPNPDMRAAAESFLAGFPDFRSINGSAEATTLPDRSIDLIVAGQAFHWFDVPKARTEFLRILKPGGFVALVWNTRLLDANPFLRGYERLLHQYGTDYREMVHTNVTPATLRMFFGGDYQAHHLPNEQRFDREGLRGRLRSSSYTPTVGHANHEPMMHELDRLFDETNDQGRVGFLYDTELYVGRLRSMESER